MVLIRVRIHFRTHVCVRGGTSLASLRSARSARSVPVFIVLCNYFVCSCSHSWFDLWIRFIDSIHWFDLLTWFIDWIRWFDSLIRFLDSVHGFDSWIGFIDSFRLFGSLIRFLDRFRSYSNLLIPSYRIALSRHRVVHRIAFPETKMTENLQTLTQTLLRT